MREISISESINSFESIGNNLNRIRLDENEVLILRGAGDKRYQHTTKQNKLKLPEIICGREFRARKIIKIED